MKFSTIHQHLSNGVFDFLASKTTVGNHNDILADSNLIETVTRILTIYNNMENTLQVIVQAGVITGDKSKVGEFRFLGCSNCFIPEILVEPFL